MKEKKRKINKKWSNWSNWIEKCVHWNSQKQLRQKKQFISSSLPVNELFSYFFNYYRYEKKISHISFIKTEAITSCDSRWSVVAPVAVDDRFMPSWLES